MKSNFIINKPSPDEYPEWFAGEIEPIHYNDLIAGLSDAFEQSFSLLNKLDQAQLLLRYAEGKWTIKEIWQHIIDVERVLTYRAMRYARKDKTVLPGFDEKSYAVESNANSRNWNNLLDEYKDVRKSSIQLFNSFDEEMIMNRGTAGRSNMTVRSVGYLIVGHDIHHRIIIKERYLT